MEMLQYMDRLKESRTGISAAARGLDADALQSGTKAAVNATVSAAQQQLELIARVFSQTRMKRLFRGLLRLIIKHQDKARMIRLRNNWVPIDPRSWDADMDVSANISLGKGSDNEKLQKMMLIAGKQEQIMLTLRPANPLVSPAQYGNTLAKVI